MRLASDREIVTWDALIAANPDGGHVLQTRAWGEFKRRWGWRPTYWIAGAGGRDVAVLFLRRLLPGFGTLWYAPKGPGVLDPADVVEVLSDRRAMRGAFLVKVEPEIEESVADRASWRRAGLRKSPADVQLSRATIIIDIDRDDDELLASFKPKTRYNIRLAGRRGVEVTPVPPTDANLAIMYALMASTRERAGFFLRSQRYFTQCWALQAASGQGQLFFATYQGAVLAGLFATYLGVHGWYKEGGSTKEHSAMMAPHLLQWEVMRWLRSRGVRSYDLVSVPPSSQLNEDHPLYGLYRFKSGFSETITDFVGTWDLPLRPRAYAAWQLFGETSADRLTRRLRHELLY
ncbi:MAG: peptidoglycan bridge formation glycyltransferase FemA/FemB family protein [Candidatus Dormibacteraeota bacterium]|uniref:Peptidoglycan bridge formation glycyltransferase FemA/FemB family protein n=1 Tax=Candidatus Amunia macphersoniae TaxID=3127014 RepID=A0A934KLY6_9BACT|nr:peptidoglycan bridge formation glycyltransferase FemA/FemB family protein [Candidatus Dormibacteraeota bacterium]